MKYKTKPQKPVIVEAAQSAFAGFLEDGKTPVGIGDWVVTWPDGRSKVVPDADFKTKFSIVRKRKPKPTTEAMGTS